jgi:hypothetical protein
MRIQPIVEGYGEVGAVPELILDQANPELAEAENP